LEEIATVMTLTLKASMVVTSAAYLTDAVCCQGKSKKDQPTKSLSLDAALMEGRDRLLVLA
jgi:hypothetical protein